MRKCSFPDLLRGDNVSHSLLSVIVQQRVNTVLKAMNHNVIPTHPPNDCIVLQVG